MLLAIHREIIARKNYLAPATIQTIYLGGGTPSLLNTEELQRIFDRLYENYPDQALQEVTLEANPDDLNRTYLKALSGTPVNRLSIGVQSFEDSDLKYMNRAHNAAQADYSVKAAQDAGFTNLSIDLIYGTPGLNDQQWRENIRKAIALDIAHISSYALTVEPRTALAHAIEKGKSRQPGNRQSAEQFELLMEEMALAGYEHYEISNFAKPGRYAVHNTNYWKGTHYLGIGPSAHSFNGSSRQWNVANNAAYITELLKHNRLPFETEQLTDTDQLNEYIMTSLRTMWGLDLGLITEKYGPEASEKIVRAADIYIKNRQVELHNNHLVLSRSGKLFADGIAAGLFFERG